jgi:DNA-binding NtrC family response regulator
MTLNIFMDNVETQLKSRVDSFVNELSALIKKAALEQVANALKGESAAPAAPAPAKAAPAAPAAGGKKRGPAPAPAAPAPAPAKAAKAPKAAKAAPKAAPAPAAPAAAAAKRKAGQKRSPDEIVKTTEKLLQYITKNTGQRIEEIAKGVGHSTKELTLPVKKLLNDKKIVAKGEKRATRYFLAGKAA